MTHAAHLIKSLVKLKAFLKTGNNRFWKQNLNKIAIQIQMTRFKVCKIANLILFRKHFPCQNMLFIFKYFTGSQK